MLAPRLAELEETHRRKQRLWFPTELLRNTPHTVRLEPEAVLMLCLNTLTELGLPHFHRLLATHVGCRGGLMRWIYMWTAEEDRHGEVLSAYLRRVAGLDHLALERMRYTYIDAGFDPDWEGSPYRLIAYTVLQEVATKVAHENVGKVFCANDESGLGTILKRIGGDEARHAHFYRGVFAGILEHDPKGGVQAFESALRVFTMPGATIPGFADLEYLAARMHVFDMAQFADIIENACEKLELERLGTHEVFMEDQSAMRSLRAILERPARMRRLDGRVRRTTGRTFSTPLLPGWEMTI